MQKKGRKRIKNEGILHDEVKEDHHVFITPSAWQKLKVFAGRNGVSISESIELWARNLDGE